jgi:predicted transcriptional regulator
MRMMRQLTLVVPDDLAQRLDRLAAEQQKSVEQVTLEQLASVLEATEASMDEQYERFVRESGLFVEFSEEEKRRYQPVSEQRLKELGAKLAAAGPLSEVIIEERQER